MCMELWDGGQWFRITEDKDVFEWVDVNQLASVPVLIPSDDKFRNEWIKNNPDADISDMSPYMEYVPDKDISADDGEIIAKAGQRQTKRAEFDIDVSIGEGLPTNKLSLYNIILSLAQLQLIDEQTGMPRPLIGFTQGRKMIEDLIGIQFEAYVEENEAMMQQSGMMGNIPQQNQRPINMNPNIPGSNINGTAMTGSVV